MRKLLVAALGLALGSPLECRPPIRVAGEDAPTRLETITLRLADPVATVDERYLSVAVDTAQVVGAAFWSPDAGVEAPGGVHPVAPYDFARPRLRRLARELAPAYLRIGGTAADKVFYDLGDAPLAQAPTPYRAVLTRAQWDGVNAFAMALDYRVVFTLNAGPGPRDANDDWQPGNARSLLEYTQAKRYPVALWDFGNEANAYPITVRLGYRVGASVLAKDVAAARALVDATTPGALFAAPSSAYWPVIGEFLPIYDDFLAAGGAASIDVVTWHYYPQQSRRCLLATRRASPDRMFDPSTLNEIDAWAARVEAGRDAHARGKPVWLGESGNAQCGGEPGVSDAFVSGFWWLDELGRMARRGQSVLVRQTLSGSNYGLLDDDTLAPRPDYWTAVLWRRLIGARVLEASAGGDSLLRVYAHCTRAGAPDARPGAVTLAVINLDPARGISLVLDAYGETADVYELSSRDMASSETRLNGVTLTVEDDGSPPLLPPRVVHGRAGSLRAHFAPATYGFVVLPHAAAPACP
jgi:heparanase 1